MMEADRLLAERLQTREIKELTNEEKGKLFMELMEKRRKHFAALRAQEKRNRPPTMAQRDVKCYFFLEARWVVHIQTANGEKSYDEIQKWLSKDERGTDKHEEVEADDTDELKKHLVIKKDDDIVIDVIPLATKPPS
ncbi:hypothetical protein Tco_0734994 [Tanacetum coccineum]